MGDPEADTDNEVLKMEQVVQVGLVAFLLVGWIHFTNCIGCNIIKLGRGERGDVTILPTLVINNAQYRGIDFLFSFS